MPGIRTGSLFLVVVLGAAAAPAGAAPMMLAATNFPGLDNITGAVDGINPAAAGPSSYLVGREHLARTIDPATGEYVPVSTQINNDFQFDLGVKDPATSQLAGPYLLVRGHVQGQISSQSVSSNLNGELSGVATSAQVIGTSSDPVPQALLDLAQNPARMSIAGSVDGGGRNMLGASLLILPAAVTVVPEPSGVAMFLAVVWTVVLGRRRRRS
jgi:hypothetical protein